jgi:hypothetical protein
MARVILPESKLRARRRRRRFTALGLFGVFVVALFIGVVYASRASFLQIRQISVSGTSALDPQQIVALAQQEVSGNYLHLFPKTNILLYPQSQIRIDLLAAYPSIEGVEVRASSFHSIAIAVTEREPAALWCGADTTASSSCLLMDSNGLAYGNGLTPPSSVYEKYYGALGSGQLPRQYLDPATFQSLSALVDALAKRQTPDAVASVSVDANGDAYLTFASGFVLIFASGDDGGDVYDRFGLALQTDPFTTHPLSDFAYLDLRFGDHLYYKLKSAQ